MSQEYSRSIVNGLRKCKIATFQMVAISHLLHADCTHKIPQFCVFPEGIPPFHIQIRKVVTDDQARW